VIRQSQLHIWQHLSDFVCTDPHVIVRDTTRPRRWHAFIVDPRTGLLRRNPTRVPKYRPTQVENNGDRIRVNDRLEYRQLDGIWYEFTFAIPPADGSAFDLLLRKPLSQLTAEELQTEYGRFVFASGKRQLNKQEIRRVAAGRCAESSARRDLSSKGDTGLEPVTLRV